MLAWAKSIACYTIAISLLMGILPEGRHKKYIKFFTGVILSLLLVSPVLKLFSIDMSLAEHYKLNIEKLWEEELKEQEKEQFQAVVEQSLNTMGYSLEQIERKEKWYLWIRKSSDVFEIPVVRVEIVEQSEKQKEMIQLKQVICAICGVEEEKLEIIVK